MLYFFFKVFNEKTNTRSHTLIYLYVHFFICFISVYRKTQVWIKLYRGKVWELWKLCAILLADLSCCCFYFSFFLFLGFFFVAIFKTTIHQQLRSLPFLTTWTSNCNEKLHSHALTLSFVASQAPTIKQKTKYQNKFTF